MRIMFRDRLELLPTTAWNAFFSDGYLVEWVYGKQTGDQERALARPGGYGGEGYITEEDAVDVAAQLLYRTPLATYAERAYYSVHGGIHR